MKISKEFKVGIVAIGAIFLLYWGVSFLKGSDIFSTDRMFYAVYHNTEGLAFGKSVQINGHKVGLVKEIYFHPDGSGRLIAQVNMVNPIDIPKNSVATITSSGLLGEKSITINLGNSLELAQSGDTLISNIEGGLAEEVSAQIAPIKAKAEKLLSSFDTVLVTLQMILSDDLHGNLSGTMGNIKRSFKNIEVISSELSVYLKDNRDELTTFTENVASISENLAKNNDTLTTILSNFSNISDSIAKANITQTFLALQGTLEKTDSIMGKINRGEGSLGALVNDDKLAKELNEASVNLNRLLLDIKYNPNRYVNFAVFGTSGEYTEEEINEMEAIRKKKEQEAKNKEPKE